MNTVKLLTVSISAIATLLVSAATSFADDTELYVIDSTVRVGKRPQILFIFDNSGSMSTEDENAISTYCSAEEKAAEVCNYPEGFETYLNSYSGYINEKGIYWNAGGIDNTSLAPTPDDPNDARRFYLNNNNCNTAKKTLEEKGRYTGYFREFNKNRWEPLANNNGFNDNDIVDCFEDIINKDPKNPGSDRQGKTATPFADGYPVNTAKMYTTGASDTDAKFSLDNTEFGKEPPVTLYTAHYLVWYKWVTTTEAGQSSGGTGTRLDVAKAALTSALDTLAIPIDAALAVFNLNYPAENDADGGRIIYDMHEMTSTNKTALTSLINGMPAQTNTPLCETLYEAYKYFSGGSVEFGNDDVNPSGTGNGHVEGYVANSPPNVFGDGPYISPFKTCEDTAYIIYITDGAPTLDKAADGQISELISGAKVDADYSPVTFINDDEVEEESYMPALAAYMFNNDVVVGPTDSEGNDNKQNVRLYTIGFSDGADRAAKILNEAALRGGNETVDTNGISTGYYRAHTGLDLVDAIDNTLKSILSVDLSFTSPSIASNNFDKTQTYNSAYFAMFLPGSGPRWSGNLKKLKVNSKGELVGPDGELGVVDSDGNIATTTCTFWNSCPQNNTDGNKVKSGGVLPALRDALTDRVIFTNSGDSLIPLSDVSDSDLAVALGGGIDSTGVTPYRNWIYGVDVDDEDRDGNISDAREDIMGDPLHSKPLAINFGPSTTNLDVRIILGTNQGLVHMFKDSDSGSKDFSVGSVSESWAFIPSELVSNVPTLRTDDSTGQHSVYGMDLSPISYVETSTSGAVTKAWVYLGMRRGGSSYYALDISSPDAPKFGWTITPSTTGYEDLGQTWSEPVVTKIPGYEGTVLIFGGGYPSATANGQAIYIADAFTGNLVRSFTTSGLDSVPNRVAILDSNNDGITDRVYASDISGNIWRMDLAGTDNTKWTIFKFASVGGTDANARMFFAEPTVAQTQFSNISSETVDGVTTNSYQTIPYDAVTIGTGNRTHPLDVTTNDMFYVFQDRNVVSKNFDGTVNSIPSALTIDNLYNVSSAAPSSENEYILFGEKRGWYFDYSVAGEKTLSASLIFNGQVHFTSFIPPVNATPDYDAGVCGYSAGEGRLYVFDLHRGTRSYSQIYYELGQRVPDTPQIVIPEPDEGEEAQAYLIGVGKGERENGQYTGTISLGGGLTTNRIYYHVNEN
ncbi:type IV pilin biogenesis protein [Shewanella avicenniae]|uniref:Type IV pilin biogenesis protein n=1 Tax=Shewanella avicenniae TaxID=2814294 RepID=A0ABX7QV03_9GAMM|nr:PilC/PilY family type IV pilus protein [Shewanella avicenniae]QSX34740.1 type IV pilin biogenesis protein [Shewanella avicenniae]